MADVTLVLWRDIPAQVLQGKGRGAVRITLDERFEQAINRAAMKAGLSGTDDYLGESNNREARLFAAKLIKDGDKGSCTPMKILFSCD